MSKRAKVIILFLLFLIGVVVVFLCCTYAKNINTAQVSKNIYAMNEPASIAEEENKIEDNTTKVPENAVENVVENKVNPEPEVPDESENNKNDTQVENSEIEYDNDEDKAINIVKKDWGNTSGVAFKVEQINADGSYIISVRNESSIAMAWYTVYPKTGKFTK